MKRPLTLTGAILATVGQAIYAILALLAFITYCETGYVATIIISLLITLVVLTALIMNILSIPAWNKSKEIYKKKKGLIITAVVFNFIVVLYQIIELCVSYFIPIGIIILYIILIGLAVSGNVLMLIDLARENKKVKMAENGGNVQDEQKVEIDNKVQAAEEFAQKMAKINALKEQGILSEEEFSEIKKSYVKDYVK